MDILDTSDGLASYDRLQAAIQAKAEDAIARYIDAGAAVMVKEPWRISRAVYPHEGVLREPDERCNVTIRASVWPSRDPATGKVRTEIEVLHDCCVAIANTMGMARNHGVFDTDRMLVLRQAEKALTRMVEGW